MSLPMDAADPTPHFERFGDYEQAFREFRWRIPERINIASAICRRHTDSVSRIALSDVKEGGINTYTFGGLDFLSDRFATALFESGVSRGDSVAVVLQPSAALAVAHLGALKAGAVVVPLSTASDPTLFQHALADSNARALIIDESTNGSCAAIAQNMPGLKSRFVVRDLRPNDVNAAFKDFWSEVDRASADFDAVQSDSNDAAFIFYIQSQGRISGIVHSHRSGIGQLAAFEMFNDVEDRSVFWTSGDWSSPTAALGVLYPAWWYGCSVVARAVEGGPATLRLLEQCGVTNVFIQSGASATPAFFKASPRSFVAEADQKSKRWVKTDPSATLCEVYGKPETGWILGKCERWFATPTGAVGRPIPGRLIAIIDQKGDILPQGKTGHIAVHKSDPALFSEYRGATGNTAATFLGEWFLTGDGGYKNGDGDFFIAPSPSVVGAD